MIRDIHPGDPGSRGQEGTGSRIRIRNTAQTAFTSEMKLALD
jgi:hypothetical protein